MDRIGPLTTAWVSISMQLENELTTKYGWTLEQVSTYRSSVFNQQANIVGLNLWHTNLANQFVENVFNVTNGCNDLAIDIQETFKDTLDKSIGVFPKENQDQTDQQADKPKRKM